MPGNNVKEPSRWSSDPPLCIWLYCRSSLSGLLKMAGRGCGCWVSEMMRERDKLRKAAEKWCDTQGLEVKERSVANHNYLPDFPCFRPNLNRTGFSLFIFITNFFQICFAACTEWVLMYFILLAITGINRRGLFSAQAVLVWPEGWTLTGWSDGQ